MSTAAMLEHALELTRAMLAAARAQAWPRLIELEVEREPLLLQQHGPDHATRAQLGEILAYDRQLQEVVRGARDAVAEQWQRETDRSRAISAYAQP